MIDLQLPLGGLSEKPPLEKQSKATTPACQNVRPFDAENRERLAQRSGIKKYCPTQPNGGNPVQEIVHCVVESAQAAPFGLGWAYVPLGTSFVLLDWSTGAPLTPPGGLPSPLAGYHGVFDQDGNLYQLQETDTDGFAVERRNFGRRIDPNAQAAGGVDGGGIVLGDGLQEWRFADLAECI